MNINFYIKTRSLNLDRRVHKMWNSLTQCGAKVSLIYCSNDKLKEDKFNLDQVREINLFGGAAPQSKLKRFFGAIQFSIHAILKAPKGPSTIHWVNDPILFTLIIFLAKLNRGYIVWDHHELPPDWVLENKLVKQLFRFAYKKASAVIHTNTQRAAHLESALSWQHPNKVIIPNYPEAIEVIQSKVVELNSTKLGEYVYLQNTIGSGRCDIEIMKAIKDSGLKAVHAGNVNTERLEFLKEELGNLDFCEFVGACSLEEINYLLRNALCTTIFYRNTSMNNWLCEPNRLYQAKLMNCIIVAGNNPTLVCGLADYPLGINVNTDGNHYSEIETGLKKAKEIFANKKNSDGQNRDPMPLWNDYTFVIEGIVMNATSARDGRI